MTTKQAWRMRLALLCALGATGGLAQASGCGGAYTHLPDSEFADAGRGMVRHLATGLVWKRCAEGQSWNGKTCIGQAATYTAEQAQDRVFAVNASAPGTQNGGGTSWRLPHLGELRLLVKLGCVDPAINQRMFPKAPASRVWTATPYVGAEDANWAVDFEHGTVQWAERRDTITMRLVRAEGAPVARRPEASLREPSREPSWTAPTQTSTITVAMRPGVRPAHDLPLPPGMTHANTPGGPGYTPITRLVPPGAPPGGPPRTPPPGPWPGDLCSP